jgi:hypothetical protein
MIEVYIGECKNWLIPLWHINDMMDRARSSDPSGDVRLQIPPNSDQLRIALAPSFTTTSINNDVEKSRMAEVQWRLTAYYVTLGKVWKRSSQFETLDH